MNSTLQALFNLFCLVYGSFFTLYFTIKFTQKGRANLWAILLALVALTWGIYSIFGDKI